MQPYYGVIEMIFSFGIVLGLAAWSLISLEKAKKNLLGDQDSRQRSEDSTK